MVFNAIDSPDIVSSSKQPKYDLVPWIQKHNLRFLERGRQKIHKNYLVKPICKIGVKISKKFRSWLFFADSEQCLVIPKQVG